MSESMAGVNWAGVSFTEFSCAMASSTCSRRIRILSSNFVRCFSTLLRQTKVYLLALDSILVPSIYSTSRLMKPLSARTRTNWVNTLFISSLYTVTKTIDGDKIRMLITGKPDIMNVTQEKLLYFTARIDIIHVGVDNYLKHHF